MSRKKRSRNNRNNRLRRSPPPPKTAAAPPPAAAVPVTGYNRWLVVGTVAVLGLGGLLAYFWFGARQAMLPAPAAVSPPAAHYVGGQTCATCHTQAYEAWRGSHHALAMQEATAQTVLGDFNDAHFTYAGITSTFFKRDGKFYVNTDGPDGERHDYEITYTFGVTPLQQYLSEFPGGRLQALSIAWDARPREQGGQRWFHLYPDERITHTDELHWTKPQQNWNFMCADCHSTNLQKHYDAASRTFTTTWSALNVSCEACHGPGSQHVQWAQRATPEAAKTDASKGLVVSFAERRARGWTIDPQRGAAQTREAHPLRAELEVCAPCHARRTAIADGFAAGQPFLDYYLPALLEPRLYHADGQQRDEVYTWGSFVQSKMYHQGVTCSDCHEPHSLTLRAPGNAVCAQCHTPTQYDAASHHFHTPGGPGAQCVACHMPATTYMVIDPRHDHSLRVPRPDLSITLGVPNACTQCHRDQQPQWAAERIRKWYGQAPEGFQRYAFTPRGAEAVSRLALLLEDTAQPEIARATAAAAIARTPHPTSVAAARKALGDHSALVRHAALASVEVLPPAQRVGLVAPLLNDPVRIVRLEAAHVLASVPSEVFTLAQRASFDRVVDEYEAAQRLHAERPEHRTNLGTFYAQLGRYAEAEAEFRAALELLPAYVPAWVNFADLRRLQGHDRDAESLLRDGLKAAPDNASLHHTLGLTLVRLQRTAEAVPELAHAAHLAPEESRFAYVYAVALHSTGQLQEALEALEQALARHPGDRDLLFAAVVFSREAGNPTAALQYAERLVAQMPWDAAARRLVEELRAHPDVKR
jgi:tetratricopeptide (TPR) repeat protein